MTTSDKIREILRVKGISQKEFAELLRSKCYKDTKEKSMVVQVCQWLKPSYNFKATQLENIALALGVSTSELLDDPVYKSKDPEVNGYIEYNDKVYSIKKLKDLEAIYTKISKYKEYLSLKEPKIANKAAITLDQINLNKWERYDASKIEIKSFRHYYDIVDGRVYALGNMCSGFPFDLNGIEFKSSEAAYIAGVYSQNSTEQNRLQEILCDIDDGYKAKKEYRHKRYLHVARPDWQEFNVEWMKYVVWQKCKGNKDFALLLKSIPDSTMVLENSTGMTGETAQFWGCFNQTLEDVRDAKEQYYSQTHPKANAEEINVERNRWHNFGVWEGVNTMGKILKMCSICLKSGKELPIDYDLLRRYDICILGDKIPFDEKNEVSVTDLNSYRPFDWQAYRDGKSIVEEQKATTINVKAVLFDFDGTLLNTDNVQPYVEALRKCKRFSDEWNAAQKQIKDNVKGTLEYDGMANVLETLKKKGIGAFIVTNTATDRVVRTLKAVGYDKYFTKEMIVGCHTKSGMAKTASKKNGDPELFLSALEILNLQPTEVVSFGNAYNDSVAARNAGVLGYHCTWGAKDEDKEKMASQPNITINSPSQILEVISNGHE